MGNAKKKKAARKNTGGTKKKAPQTKASSKKTTKKASGTKKKTAASSKSTSAGPTPKKSPKKNPVGEFKMKTSPKPEPQAAAGSEAMDEIFAESAGGGSRTVFEGAQLPEVEFQESPATTSTAGEAEAQDLSTLLQLDDEAEAVESAEQPATMQPVVPTQTKETQAQKPKGFFAMLVSKLRRLFGGA